MIFKIIMFSVALICLMVGLYLLFRSNFDDIEDRALRKITEALVIYTGMGTTVIGIGGLIGFLAKTLEWWGNSW